MRSAAASGAMCIRRSRRDLNDRAASVAVQGLAARRRVGPRPAMTPPRTPVAHVSAEGLPDLPPAQLFCGASRSASDSPIPAPRSRPRACRPSSPFRTSPPRRLGWTKEKGLRVNAGRSKRVPEEPGENPASAVERWVQRTNTGSGRPNAGNEHRRGFSEGRFAAFAYVGVSPALRWKVRAMPVPSGPPAN
jgi:hypothetical protein